MLRALRTAASGMTAQQLYIDLVAHNLANVNTTGFKKSRASFEDLLYQTLRPAGPGEGDTQVPAPLQVGHGTKLVSTPKVFSQGDSEVTGNPMDVAIEGDGFFQIQMPDGTTGYSRSGELRIDGEGRLVTPRGLPLTPDITVPEDTEGILIDAQGKVYVRTAGSEAATELGQLLLARFVNPSGLEATGGNLLRLSPSSGNPIVG
ncbi:MAG: flagellar hook-basal body complex protein, partial [Candidatus Eisenbacteria sp.]|nr:flagellar hook-basal body complex protein [Candidatus Eisenbacteria bacterium]